MEDLGNERRAVVEQIRELGLEPVNAEALLPNGDTSWNLLADEIRTSHLFVLILGDRYGWVPTTGYGAGQGRSVTHLEAELARSLDIPLLPFFKRLKYQADDKSTDAVLRDKFRKEVSDWTSGVFRTEFEWADDLGNKVRQSLLDLFQDSFLKLAVRKHAEQLPPPPENEKLLQAPATLQQDLGVEANGKLLFAGAGLSIAAGYPTAHALAGVLANRAGLSSDGEDILGRHPLGDVVALAEAKIGRSGVVSVVNELLDTALVVEPTTAHVLAVQKFPVIITTNFDLLFERACALLRLDHVVHTPTSFGERRAGLTIYKVDGSIDSADSLVLTDYDAARVRGNVDFWRALADELGKREVAVVGHSLRDPTSRSLVAARNMKLPGVYVSPFLSELDEVLLHRYGLTGIKADAATFLSAV